MAAYQRKPCKRCGGSKGDAVHPVSSWYCVSCQADVHHEYRRKHYLCGSNERDHEYWKCADCRAVDRARKSAASLKALATRHKRHPHWKRPAHAHEFWQRKALAMVNAAKKFGILPKLDGSIACDDCGVPAQVYEHRDYSRPLDVVPVCESCNHKRGTASWPSAEQFKFKKVAGHEAVQMSDEKNLTEVVCEVLRITEKAYETAFTSRG